MAARQLRVQASLARRGHGAAPVLPPLTSSPLWLRPPLPLPLLLLLPAPSAPKAPFFRFFHFLFFKF